MFADVPELIALGLAIAISPLPIAALLLKLMSPDGFRATVGLAAGWFLGVGASAAGLSFLSTLLPDHDADAVAPFVAIGSLGLGALLVLTGVVQIRGRTAVETTPDLPRWMAVLDRLDPARAAVIGFGYGAFRPKNLIFAAAAGVVIWRNNPDPATVVVSVLLFTVVASSTMIAPVLAYAFGTRVVRRNLVRLREWILSHVTLITGVTLVLVGVCLAVFGLLRL
ncbi:MAG: GAP family protein [Mycetocola sp.]